MKNIIMLTAMILAITWHHPVIAGTSDTKNVLVLHSYDNQDQWSSSVLDGLKTSLAGSDFHLHVEYLDARHHQGASYLAQFEQFFKAKYLNTHFDIAIVSDDEAFDFFLKIRPSFRSNLPIVFCGINNFKPEMIASQDKITGVNEAVDIKGTVNLALQLFPKASHLIVVAGSSGMGAINLANFRQTVPSFSRKVKIQEVLDIPRTSIDHFLSGISRESILVRLDNLREPDGTNTPLQQSISILAAHSPCPVFSFWDFDMNHGALGGIIDSGLQQGDKAGQLAVKILKGHDPASIPVVMESPNVPMIDYHQLERFGIGLDALPRTAQVINRPVSFYAMHKAIIWSIIAMFAFMLMCIAVLFTALIARRKAEKALRASEKLYRTYVDSAPSGIFTANQQGRYVDVNPQVCRTTGYDRSELLTMSIPDLLHPESIKEVTELLCRLKKEQLAFGEVRFQRKDGEYRWWSFTATSISEDMFLCFVNDVTDRRIQEENRSIFLELLDNAEHVVVFKDLQLRYVMINRAYTALTGRTLADVAGKTDAETFAGISTPEQIKKYIDNDRQALALTQGQRLTVEEDTLAADGSTRTFLSKKFPVYAQDGRLLGSGTITSEITELKRVEQALLESEERSRLLADLTMEGIIIHKNAIAIDANRALARMLGFSPADLLGVNFINFFHKDDLAIIQGNIIKEYAPPYTVRMAKRNGEYFFAEIESHNFQKQGEIWRVSAIRDITERKRAEEALRESEEKFRTVATYIHDWEYWTAPNGNLVYISPSCERITSYTAEEFQQDPGLLTRIIHPNDQENFLLHLKSAAESRTKEDCHAGYFCILTKNGEERWIAHTCREVFDREGKSIGHRVSNQDITERKRAEKEKERIQAELIQAQKMEAIGTLAGGIAHDFNNILAAILGYAEMAYEDSLQGSVNPNDLNQVVKAGHRAKDLVKQILAFSRQADSQKISLHLTTLVKESIKLLRSSIPTTIHIHQDIDAETNLILADPTQIHQIIMNLCANAYHAMEETGGTLSLSLQNRVLTQQDLGATPDVQPGHFVELSVKDTGCGIAPEIQERIFDPYFTTKGAGKGTGMGLAIVHGLVKGYGGFIICKSEIGVGTVFQIYLPASLEQIIPETQELELIPTGTERILFVDDEEILANMGRTLLERLGYQVTIQMSSVEALATFKTQPESFDLVITDQTMPEITGLDLAQRILQIRPDMPIILCTGYSTQISDDKIKSYGIKGFAMKPLARKEIAALTRKVLDEGRALR